MFFYDLLKDNGKFSKPMISSKTTTKILYGNLKKRFFESEKMASGKIFRHFLHANFFMFILLLSNRTVFLVQCGINLHLRVFEELARAMYAEFSNKHTGRNAVSIEQVSLGRD